MKGSNGGFVTWVRSGKLGASAAGLGSKLNIGSTSSVSLLNGRLWIHNRGELVSTVTSTAVVSNSSIFTKDGVLSPPPPKRNNNCFQSLWQHIPRVKAKLSIGGKNWTSEILRSIGCVDIQKVT
ncbi:hypothetical protein E1B28_009797 [Marasmius oreades]|uniref:Uncharacterized protein n=1 Tax=Marasmius oreades TaxID=181124 RepID=A0A9P7RX98_9AGAR|nr:uncharacterized protein E1B28_009797 [Marasmius oreades]KAG7090703.1 hypothetical protein E1B28_009797 [Marasmius oreades]